MTPSGPARPPRAQASKRTLEVRRLGVVPYGEGLRIQEDLVAARRAGEAPDTLLLLEHPHLAKCYGQQARQRVCERFSDERMARETEELYLAWLALLTCLGGVVAVVLWLLAQFLALPLIRAEAEAAEHDYSLGSELQGTYTSLGERKLIHPVGDGYHLLHHMFPSVPGPELRALHDVAVAQWPEYGSKAALYKLGKNNAQPIVS